MKMVTPFGWLMRVLFALALASIVCVAWVSYQPLIMTHNRFCREDLRLTEELQKEKAKQARLLEAIEAVKKDPKVVERLAREKLGLAKPGETVVHFD